MSFFVLEFVPFLTESIFKILIYLLFNNIGLFQNCSFCYWYMIPKNFSCFEFVLKVILRDSVHFSKHNFFYLSCRFKFKTFQCGF